MANVVGLRLPLPVLGSVCVSHSSSTFATTLSTPPLNNLNWKVKGPRRMVLGLGVSFFSQFLTMGTNSFIASARIKGGPSVDEVIVYFMFHSLKLCITYI